MDSKRSALIVASYEFEDPGLRRLRAPGQDAEALARVLSHPEIGGFEVHTILNESAYVINEAIEEFFGDRSADDLLLVHFSCHGVKDEAGELYFATSNTKLRRLAATAVAADFVNRRMNRSRSRRIVLLLDCCYAGAFERGVVARAGGDVAIGEQFGGRGRAVITSSSAMEYAFEGDELADAREPKPSVFTSALVEGLETGEADRDQDGHVALDELYEYVFDKVRDVTPYQTPGKWTFGVQGDLYIARRRGPITKPAALSPELQQAIDHPIAGMRMGAVQELGRLLHSSHGGIALGAKLALEHLTEDDSRLVSAAARAALDADVPATPAEPVPPKLELSTSVIDFGRLGRHRKSPQRSVRFWNAGGGNLNARAATSASWIRLHQEADELIVTVDTTVVGDREGVVTVESAGGSAGIRILAHIEAEAEPATEIAATAPSPIVPEISKDSQEGEPEEPAALEDGTERPTQLLGLGPGNRDAQTLIELVESRSSHAPPERPIGRSQWQWVLWAALGALVLIVVIVVIASRSGGSPSPSPEPSVSPSSVPLSAVVFDDDFSSDKGWDTRPSKNFLTVLKPGALHNSVTQPDQSYHENYPGTAVYSRVKVDAAMVVTGGSGYLGVGCITGGSGGYVFWIGPTGYASIGVSTSDTTKPATILKGATIQGWDPSKRHTLSATCSAASTGTSLEFLVDGQSIVKASDGTYTKDFTPAYLVESAKQTTVDFDLLRFTVTSLG